MSFPMASMLPASDDVTGSISKVPFGALLDEEDRRREKAALATALDPQGNGASVHWENPRSGNNGSLTAVGPAYPADSRICRAFVGTLKTADVVKSVQATACAVAAGEWVVAHPEHQAKS
jgi:surface antigen